MIGGVTLRGAFPGLPDVSPRVTRLTGAEFVLHQIRAELN